MLLLSGKATSRRGVQPPWFPKIGHLFVSIQAGSVAGECEGTAEVLGLLLSLLPCKRCI